MSCGQSPISVIITIFRVQRLYEGPLNYARCGGGGVGMNDAEYVFLLCNFRSGLVYLHYVYRLATGMKSLAKPLFIGNKCSLVLLRSQPSDDCFSQNLYTSL